MEKQIGEITLFELQTICEKYIRNSCRKCPFFNYSICLETPCDMFELDEKINLGE